MDGRMNDRELVDTTLAITITTVMMNATCIYTAISLLDSDKPVGAVALIAVTAIYDTCLAHYCYQSCRSSQSSSNSRRMFGAAVEPSISDAPYDMLSPTPSRV